MPEFYKKVVAVQFSLTDVQKAAVKNGEPVTFEALPVKYIGENRFHILFPVGEVPIPVREGQWIVRNPGIEIVADHDFLAIYTPVVPVGLMAPLAMSVASGTPIPKPVILSQHIQTGKLTVPDKDQSEQIQKS